MMTNEHTEASMTQELRQLAEAATQGEWFFVNHNNEVDESTPTDDWSVKTSFGKVVCSEPQCKLADLPDVCNGAYIAAANPAAILSLLDRLEKAEKDAAVAIGMLADWCVAVDQNGAGWDDWDEHYKDAMYRPCPIREQLDEAIKYAMEASK